MPSVHGPRARGAWPEARPVTPARYPRCPVKSTVETLEGNKVKLSVEVDEAEFDRDIDGPSARSPARSGSPASAPARRRAGCSRPASGSPRPASRRCATPSRTYLAKAVREHDVDLDRHARDRDHRRARRTARSSSTPPARSGPRSPCPATTGCASSCRRPTPPTTRSRRRSGPSFAGTARSTDVERPAARGDQVTLDLSATRDGEDVAGLNTEDWSYEVGQGWVADDFDDQLVGAVRRRRAEFTHDAERHRGAGRLRRHRRRRCRRWCCPSSPTSGSARTSASSTPSRSGGRRSRERLGESKLNQARQQLVGRVTEALTALVDIEPPESMVQSDLQRRVENTVRQLQAQGIDVEQWLSATGQDANALHRGHEGRSPSRRSRSTSRCGPSPSPRASRPTTTTSTPSTSGWRCRSSRSRTRSARPTSRTTLVPT